MSWKLILFLICLVLTTIFIGFNLENTCTINLLFITYTDIPIFIVVLSSVIVGVFIAGVFMIKTKIAKKAKPSTNETKEESIQTKKSMFHKHDKKVEKKKNDETIFLNTPIEEAENIEKPADIIHLEAKND